MMKVSDLAEYFTNKLGDMQDYQFGMCVKDVDGNYHLFNTLNIIVDDEKEIVYFEPCNE